MRRRTPGAYRCELRGLVLGTWENKGMKRQRGGLVPIDDALSSMGGSVKAIREASPQALHHFTRFDQVNQLVSASEADASLGFMARTMALCSLPRSNPGNRKEYERVNGPFTLYMVAGGGNKLPYGNLPRLILAWVSTEAVRTQSRELVLGKSLSEFMRTLGIYNSGGNRRWCMNRNWPATNPTHRSITYQERTAIGHPVEDVTPDRNFSPLCLAVPRLQSASEHGLVSEEAVFNARLLSVARLLLPLSSPDLANPLKSRVTLRPGAVRWPRRHRRATRGNHNHDVLCTGRAELIVD